MKTSKFIAKIYSLIYLPAGIGYLVSSEHYKIIVDTLLEPSYIIVLLGFLSVIAGLTMTEYHNIWQKNWRGAITLFGWLTLIQGIVILIFPNFFSYFRDMVQSPEYFIGGGIFSILMGLFFGYHGFWHKEIKTTTNHN